MISLGSFVVHKLRQRGAKDVFVPRRADYDLVQADAIRRLLSDARPDVLIPLAARRRPARCARSARLPRSAGSQWHPKEQDDSPCPELQWLSQE